MYNRRGGWFACLSSSRSISNRLFRMQRNHGRNRLSLSSKCAVRRMTQRSMTVRVCFHGTKPYAMKSATTHALRSSTSAPTIIFCTFRFVHLRSPRQGYGPARGFPPTSSTSRLGICTLFLHARPPNKSQMQTVGHTRHERHSTSSLTAPRRTYPVE